MIDSYRFTILLTGLTPQYAAYAICRAYQAYDQRCTLAGTHAALRATTDDGPWLIARNACGRIHIDSPLLPPNHGILDKVLHDLQQSGAEFDQRFEVMAYDREGALAPDHIKAAYLASRT